VNSTQGNHYALDNICHSAGALGWNTEKKDAQIGPIEIKHQEKHGIDFPPILSGLCVVGGIVLVVVGSRQS